MPQRLLDAHAERPARVQALPRLLEDDVGLELRVLRPRARRDVPDLFPEEPDLAGRRANETGDAVPDGRLAGAALADERQRLPRLDRERDAVDGVHGVAVALVVLDEVTNLEQGRRTRRRDRTSPARRGGLLSNRRLRGRSARLRLFAACSHRRPQQVAAVLAARVGEELSDGGLLDELPVAQHDDPVAVVGDLREVARGEDAGSARLADEGPEKIEDLDLDRHVQAGRRLVGHQQLGRIRQGERYHDALAHSAGELVRIRLEPLSCVRNADRSQELLGAAAAKRSLHAVVGVHHVDELVSDAPNGIKSGTRAGLDQRDRRAAAVAHRLVVEDRQGLPPKADLAAGDALVGMEHPEDRSQEGRLAGAALSDDPEDLAFCEVEGELVESSHHSLPRRLVLGRQL
jgi:hypothetical protein